MPSLLLTHAGCGRLMRCLVMQCRFLTVDLGISHYPPYDIQRSMHAFPDRETLLAYEEALQHAAALDAALEVCAILCSPMNSDFWCGRKRQTQSYTGDSLNSSSLCRQKQAKATCSNVQSIGIPITNLLTSCQHHGQRSLCLHVTMISCMSMTCRLEFQLCLALT